MTSSNHVRTMALGMAAKIEWAFEHSPQKEWPNKANLHYHILEHFSMKVHMVKVKMLVDNLVSSLKAIYTAL